jgi:chromosome segregation ATPase
MAFAATLANEEEDLVNEAARLADAYEAMERELVAEHADHHRTIDAAERAAEFIEQQNNAVRVASDEIAKLAQENATLRGQVEGLRTEIEAALKIESAASLWYFVQNELKSAIPKLTLEAVEVRSYIDAAVQLQSELDELKKSSEAERQLRLDVSSDVVELRKVLRDMVAAIKDSIATGTSMNNHKYDSVGIQALAALAGKVE